MFQKNSINWLFIIICVVMLLAGCSSLNTETDLLECDAATMTHFPYAENGVIVVKHQKRIPVAEFPGLTRIETYYVNKGKPITVRAYEMCRTEIEATDSVVWSLQPSSTNGRLDWVLPVTEGFKKENYRYSQAIGRSLFEKIEELGVEVVSTDCETCKWQIEMSTSAKVMNPISILAEALDVERTRALNGL